MGLCARRCVGRWVSRVWCSRQTQPPDADNGHDWYDAEDCLQVNVFSPIVNTGTNSVQTAPKLPVMFFSARPQWN